MATVEDLESGAHEMYLRMLKKTNADKQAAATLVLAVAIAGALDKIKNELSSVHRKIGDVQAEIHRKPMG